MDKNQNNIYVRLLLNEKIKLEPVFLSKNYRDEVLRRLKLKVEGICTRHGYIKPESVELHKVCIGRIEMIGLNGNTMYDVHFWADVCNPLLGSVIRCKISNVNKFGILAEAEGVIEAIIAKNSVNIQSDIDLESVRIGDEIFIEVVGKKYELNDKKLSVIGRAVRDITTKTIELHDNKVNRKVNIDDEDDEDVQDEIQSQNGGSDSDIESGEEEDDDNDNDVSSIESEIDGVKREGFYSDNDWFNSDEELGGGSDLDDGDVSATDDDEGSLSDEEA
jgi:DNA-directed RNA polymerase subunit E'/Rpb7